MFKTTSDLLALQPVVSYASTLALVVLLFFLWRRLRMAGLLLVTLGGVLNFTARVASSVVPPFRMSKMPFSHADTLDDVSRSTEFILIQTGHIVAGLLIVVGTVMVVRALADSSFEPVPDGGAVRRRR